MQQYKIVMPDYEHCSLNVTSALFHYYGLQCQYQEDLDLKKELAKGYTTIVYLILDGCGTYIMQDNLLPDNFMSTKVVKNMTCVFPSSTVPSTTAIQSGKAPIETAWLGWQQYFEKYGGKNIEMFIGQDFYSREKVVGFEGEKEVPVAKLQAKINTGVKVSELYPAFRKGGCKTFKEMTNRILKASNEMQSQFIYAYYDDPDHTMHGHGSRSDDAKRVLNSIDRCLHRLYNKMNERTLIIITADHGQRDVKYLKLNDYPDLMATLERWPSLEGRSGSFKVKKGKESQFIAEYEKHFKPYFNLYSHADLLHNHLLGLFEPHPLFNSFMDDYYLVAIDDYNLYYDPGNIDQLLIGHHGGLTIDEMVVPLIILSKK